MNLQKLMSVLLILSWGCQKNETIHTTGNYSNGFFILNEGTFNFGNATLSFYNNDADSLSEDVFKKENREPLGDVAQSLLKVRNMLLISVNNSQKIEVLDTATCKRLKTIYGFGSPRYIMDINDSIVLTTELYNKKIQVVNINQGKIIQSMDAFGWGEKMIKYGQKVMIQLKKHPTDADKRCGIAIYNIPTGQVNFMESSEEPLHVAACNQYLWMIQKKTDSSFVLSGLNMQDNSVSPQQVAFPKGDAPQCLTSNGQGNLYYLYKKQLYSLNTLVASAQVVKLQDLSGLENIYQLQFYQNKFFVFDAGNYISKGKINMYDVTGNYIKTIQTGIIPNAVL